MASKKLKIEEAKSILNAEKMEFDGSYKSDCCGSILGKGRAMYAILSGGEHNEVVDECCTVCLKKQGYFEKHRYDDFDPSTYLSNSK